MDNKERYRKIFMTELGLEEGFSEGSIVANETENWDSLGHMSLVTAIEDEFDIMFETDDILAFNSFVKGIEILKKYDVII